MMDEQDTQLTASMSNKTKLALLDLCGIRRFLGAPMTYRCLIFDQDERVREFDQLEADTVADALTKARKLGLSPETPFVEVWCKGQIVGRVSWQVHA
jgi:hypothetical protein